MAQARGSQSGPVDQQREIGGRTRRRGATLETALLDAVWAELQSTGYRAMTMEAVADRAGTSRAVLYRRWGSQADLVIAALRRHRPLLSDEVPDTGSLRGDVLALLARMSERLTETGLETIFGLLSDYLADPDLFARIQGQLVQVGAGVMTAILEHASERGEARRDISPRVATLPTDLYRNELFLRRAAPSPDVVESIVDQVFLPLVRP